MLHLFRIWKTKRVIEHPTDPPTISKTAQYLASKILKCQLLFVTKMSQLDKKANMRQKKFALFLFFGCMSAIYLFHLFSGLGNYGGSFPFDQQKVNLPTNVTLPDSLDPAKVKLEQLIQSNYDSAFNKR